MGALRVPPGRAGRRWLRERIVVADRGLELLEQKLSILEHERIQLIRRRDDTSQAWDAASRVARQWLGRAMLLGGPQSILRASPDRLAEVTVEWAITAGVRYPSEIDCALPPPGIGAVVDTTAVACAQQAHRAALSAAAVHAAAAEAVRIVERDIVATRIRVQGLRRRRLPELRTALANVELQLEEQERSDLILMRYGR